MTACKPDTQPKSSTHAIENNSSSEKEITKVSPVTEGGQFEVSTFDAADGLGNVGDFIKILKDFEKKGYLNTLSEKAQKQIHGNFKGYLDKNLQYKVLAYAQGDVFQNQKEDAVAIVYDVQKNRISILAYDQENEQVGELYRDYKVVNGLKNVDCPFGNWGTIDYMILQEISMDEQNIQQNTETYLTQENNSGLKITDISTDPLFSLKDGCFAKNVDRKNLGNSLAISISGSYLDYFALRYNKEKKYFEIYYGQAFAD